MTGTDHAAQREWRDRYAAALMNTFGPPRLVLTRGRGAKVWDADGKEYLDLFGGIAVNALGHGHPALVEAVTTQLTTLGHVSNFFATEPQVTLAERLLQLLVEEGAQRSPLVEEGAQRSPLVEEGARRSPLVEEGAQRPSRNHPDGKVFFTNSGTEANEAAFKLTRRTGRTHLVATEGAFHGRTMGALALTAKEAYRAPFEPLPGHVTFVPYGDADALAAAVTGETAAVVLEPVQGEAGVVVPPRDYLAAARRACDEHGALLWLDEVQTGIGRTGSWFAHQNPALSDPVRADVVTLAKGLGGGVPIGACVGLGDAARLLEPGNHGTTFGGNPVACAAANAVLDVVEAEGLLDASARHGKLLADLVGEPDQVVAVEGAGLFVGAQLASDTAAAVVAAAQERGFLLNNTGPGRLRFAPPLTVDEADLRAFGDAWAGILDGVHQEDA